MFQAEIQGVGTIGLAIYVLIEVLKRAGLNPRYAGVLALVFGVLIGGVSFVLLGKLWYSGVAEGFWGAAAASGIYSGTKAFFAPKEVSYEDDPALHPQC